MQLRSLLLAGLSTFGILLAGPIHAAMPAPGDLIKIGSMPDVYYYGADAKRYVFPNEKTYFSWYSGFDTKTLTSAELASIGVGGAVTYKPGYRMVKLTTDPKVYAVAKGGVLRWIQTEALAIQLYGADWATKVHDLPDAFFATYKVGASISKVADYSPSDELAAAVSISIDKGLASPPAATSTPPTATSTSNIVLNVSKTTASAGDIETITATASDPSGINKIELFFDGVLIHTCMSASCSGETQIPLSGTKSSYEVKAVATAMNATTQTKTVIVPIVAASNSLVTIAIGRSVIKSNQPAEVIIESDASIAVIRTDIYLDGDSIEACASAIRQCRWSGLLPGAVGTAYDVYGKVTDSLGRTYVTAHKTITIGTNDSPIVHTLTGKSLIYAGETVDVTVTGSDDDGIVKIEILQSGTVLKSCDGASPCMMVTGPWNTAGTITFSGRATDGLGMVSESDPVSVTVQ